eukprot:5868212-Prymnesium_polylepis.1
MGYTHTIEDCGGPGGGIGGALSLSSNTVGPYRAAVPPHSCEQLSPRLSVSREDTWNAGTRNTP